MSTTARMGCQVGDASGEVDDAMRSRLDDLRTLTDAAEGNADPSDRDALEALGVETACADLEGQAQDALYELPLSVERTTTFQVVLGTGGPDDRLVVECDDMDPEHPAFTAAYEIRRVLYRYSWTGSAERELTGDDRTAAEAFARRVVPELA